MKRILLTGAAIPSLILFMATAVLWLRDPRIMWDWTTEQGDRCFLGIEQRAFTFLCLDHSIFHYRGTVFFTTSELVLSPQHAWAGFAFNNTTGSGARQLYIVVPQWSVLAITAILPAVWIIGFKWWFTDTPYPTCSSCGYNLTGNTSGVCPECGSAAAGKAET